MTISARILIAAVLITFLSGCVSVGNTPQEKRQAIIAMKDKTLTQLYKKKPHARAQINSAPGYAVFSNANLNVILASFGGGYGMVKDNSTKKITYMRMAELGLGFGAGVKDFRIVMVFDDKQTLTQFLEQGITFGAQADAAAKASDKGGAVGAEAVVNGITVYQLTESGLVLQATVKGTKFWKDEELN